MASNTASIDSISLKLPTFWPSTPAAWFAQAEAQFSLRGITSDETKYYHVVASLDSSTASRAISILQNPPSDKKYDAIRSFLISAFGLSDYERADALFNLNGLGDVKPSQLMDSMLALLKRNEPCFLFRFLFLQQLPDYVRGPLSISPISDMRNLALEADKLYFSGRPSSTHIRAAVTQRLPHTSIENICWYHHRFQHQARKCHPSCKFFKSFVKQGNGMKDQH